MLTALAFCAPPAHARNEYLNEYGVRCGEIDFRIEDRNRDTDYRTSNSSDYDNDEQKEIALSYKQKLNDSKVWPNPVITEISPLINYYKAENYRQCLHIISQ